jgi:CDP-diacylglycerol---glycerol-3-phosphate 3-phosphatidyltransferase
LFDGRWRSGVDRGTQPIGSALHRTGLTANQLTAAGLVVATGAGYLIARGDLIWGLVALVGSALPDLLDGPLAKAAGTAGPRGAFLDSVSDRVADTVVLGGVAWHLDSVRGLHAAVLAFAVLGTSSVVSYMRAKAESLGYEARGGLMERAERIIVLCVGLAFPLLVLALWVMLLGSLVTAVQRFTKVWRQASAPTPAEEESPAKWTVAAMEQRWRARRETMRPLGARWRAGSSDPGSTWRTRRVARQVESRHARRAGRHRGAGTRP